MFQIELDFEKIFPSKNLALFSNWENFCEKIVRIYNKEIKDDKSKALLKTLEQNITEGTYFVF